MISEYEKKRLENIKQQNEMLKQLGLATKDSMNTKKVEVKKPKSVKRKREESQEKALPTRFSLRTRGQKPEPMSKEEEALVEQQQLQPAKPMDSKRVQGTIDLQDHDAILQSLADIGRETSLDELKMDCIGENEYTALKSPIAWGSVKVTKEMVFSIALHPAKDKLLAFVGDKIGNLGFWDISDTIERSQQNDENVEEFEPRVCSFKPHKKPISKIMYKASDLNKVFISSYDGSIRLMDFEHQKFDEMFVHPDEEMISHYDIDRCSDFNVCWFSDGSGQVGMLDTRATTSPVKLLAFSEKKINTLHLNPTQQHFVVTAGLDRTLKIFDLRQLKPKKVGDVSLVNPIKTCEHRLSVNSAYWDPKGVDIISTSFDDTCGLWKNALQDHSLISIKHNNNTGRWVQKFKAVWRGQEAYHATPTSEPSVFAIGNMQRMVDIYSSDRGMKLAALTDESLTAIPAVNVFHPYSNLIVSGNASGRMNVWTC